MRLLHLVLAAMITLTASLHTTAKEWRGIVPLTSTRADVERLLGPSTGDPPRYYLSENTVYFSYAECGCSETCQNNKWNVPPGTVTLIRVGLKGVVKLADLKLDLTRFEKWPGADDVPGSFVYVDKDEGFAVDGGGEFASALIYMPGAKDDRLRCPRNTAPDYYSPRRGITNRWTGATGSDFRILIGPAKPVGSPVARSTQPLYSFANARMVTS
jgi:hypothetical protein